MTDVAEVTYDGTYREHDILIRRVDAESAGYYNGFEHEFELLVNDTLILTASELEQRGPPWDESNWTRALKAYAESFIDGKHDQLNQ